MNKKCEFYMDSYLSLDKGERVPLKLTSHLLFCPECRRQIKAMSRARKITTQALDIPVPLESDTIAKVLEQIIPQAEPKNNRVKLPQWIITGILLLVCIVAFGFIAQSSSNKLIIFYAYMFFAAGISAYCALFVGTNLDFFVKKISTKKHAGRA